MYAGERMEAMITVRFPNGMVVQYNKANFAQSNVNCTYLYRKEGDNSWMVRVPLDCIVEVISPCRVYDALQEGKEYKLAELTREVRLLRMKIDLQKFCGDEKDSKVHVNRPWSRGSWTYATNGHIVLRLPKLPDVSENPKAPDVEKLFQDADERGPYEWVDVPEVTVNWLECPDCSGTGIWTEGLKHPTECEECDGKGKFTRRVPVKFEIGKVAIGLSNIYLDLIRKELPNPKIGLIEAAATTYFRVVPTNGVPVKIKFDGGIGLLMPMRISG